MGLSVSTNPFRKETCVGIGTQGGAGAYGAGSVQLCVDSDRQRSVKGSLGAGYGVGGDAASAGCAVMGYVQQPVDQRPPPSPNIRYPGYQSYQGFRRRH
jgi:hypothetical protein